MKDGKGGHGHSLPERPERRRRPATREEGLNNLASLTIAATRPYNTAAAVVGFPFIRTNASLRPSSSS